jgi:amicyanin
MSKRILSGAAAALALALLSCVGGVDHALADEAVAIRQFAFTPQDLTIHVGDTVVWTNEDPTPHSVVAKGGAFKSPKLVKGVTYSQTFGTAGTFDYVCGFHPSMAGKVVVEP